MALVSDGNGGGLGHPNGHYVRDAPVHIPSSDSSNLFVSLTEDILNKHVLVLGSTGTGKTNLINHIVHDIKSGMGPNDVMMIFDTKGDYKDRFFDQRKDVVIGNSKMYRDESQKWNIYREILIDGVKFDSYDQNAKEIAGSLFADTMEEEGTNSFFPRAAADVFGSILSAFVKTSRMEKDRMAQTLHNMALRNFMDQLKEDELFALLQADRTYGVSRHYLGDRPNEQGLGVIATLESIVREILQGVFAMDGRFSVREFIRNKGGRTLFIEYDLSVGTTLTPVYRLLVDLALKEALSRQSHEGNVYVICDEFKLLPHLKHIDDAVNFGRSLGVKVIAGIQSVNQLYDNYGEYKGKNIAAGFSSLIAFRMSDSESREFVSGRFGKKLVTDTIYSDTGKSTSSVREANVVEDWDLTKLKPLEAVVGLAFEDPFLFRFGLFR